MGLGTGAHHVRRARPRWPLAVAAGGVVVGVALAGLWILRDDGAPDDVALVPAGATPDDPWVPDLDAGRAGSEVASGAPGDAGIEVATLDEPVPVAGGQVTGTTAGLYAGTRDEPVCDLATLAGLLAGDDPSARADDWFAALGRHVDDRDDYVGDLTAVRLRFDTRADEQAPGRSRPVVLQAGTPVLIDRFGVPRVRCAGGQPLSDPAPGRDDVGPSDDAWPGFDPAAVVIVVAGPAAREFDLADPADGGALFTRPIGTAGDEDKGHASGATDEPCPDCHQMRIEIATVSGTPARIAYDGVVRPVRATATSLTWGLGVAAPGPYPYTITHDSVGYMTLDPDLPFDNPAYYDDPRYDDEELFMDGVTITECLPGDVTVTVTVDDVEVSSTTEAVPCGAGAGLSYALG
jgi:hypothetical protein